MIKIKFFVFILLLSVSIFCQKKTADKKTLDDMDIINFTFKGCPISELSIDKLTDLLGRPDLTSEDNVGKIKKVTLNYYSLGISLKFINTEENPLLKCLGFNIYLIEYLNDEAKMFSPFKGKISRDITANWKKKDLLKNFEDLHDVLYENEESFAKDKERYIWYNKNTNGSKMSRPFPCLKIRKKDYVISIFYDDLTMFLREIQIWKYLDFLPNGG